MLRQYFIEWCCDKVFYVLIQSARERRIFVATEGFYVVIELARVGRISIAIEDFYVVIELTMTESFAAHEKAGRAKAGARDNVAPCYVTIEKAMCMRQTRPGAHNRPGQVRTIEVRARRGILS